MNPYKQIAEEHLTTEELEELLAKRKGPAPKKLTYEQQRFNHYLESFTRLNHGRKTKPTTR